MSAAKEVTTLATQEQSVPAPAEAREPVSMLAMAIERGMTPEVIGQLIAHQERIDSIGARRAFDQAMADAKAEIPVVLKNRTGHNDKRYADFAAIAAAVDPILGKYGLSYRFRTHQDERIHVTCVLSHRGGHSEETTLAGPADATGNKNAIQAIGSTLTYLQRYSLVQALGLAASEDDNGAAAGSGDTITDDQAEHLRALIVETGADLPAFLAHFKIETLPELPASAHTRAIKLLEMKASRSSAARVKA